MPSESSESGKERLESALDELKDCYQRGEFVEMAAPIEDARAAARQIDTDPDVDERSPAEVRYREDCLAGHFKDEDLYPRQEIHRRVKEHAAERNAALLDAHGIDIEDLEIRWCSIEDGVVAYKVTHDDMPEVEYDYLTNEGPNTTVVPAGDRDD